MKAPFLLFFVSLTALAQLRLYTVPAPGVQTPVPTSMDLGSSAAGDIKDTTFRLRNEGSTHITLTRLRTAGVGFSLRNFPPLPHIVAPGGNVDFTVRFLPNGPGSYSATLQFNDEIVFLRATSPPGLTVLLDHEGARTVLNASTPVDFGRFERGNSTSRTFVLFNETTAALTVHSVTVDGPHFQGPEGLTLPLTLGRGESASFVVNLNPGRSGVLQSTLRIDNRAFRLEAFIQEPQFPRPEIVLSSEVVSGRQAKLRVRLSEASRARGQGTLTLQFRPADPNNTDPAVVFASSGSRSQSVSVNEGDEYATVQGSPDIVFQTGTTAGRIEIRLELGTHTHEIIADVAPAPVGIDGGSGIRITNGLELKLTGFDNTRSASELTFTFYDRNGRIVGSPVSANAGEIFREYFRTAKLGGVFAMQAIFPVAGNSADVASVEVEFKNAAGSGKSQRIEFR
jgi:hypothetical protein